MRRLNLAFLVLELTGCDRASMMKKMIPQHDAAVATHYVEAIRKGEYETVEHDADDSISGSDLHETLTRLTAIFPHPSEEPKSVKPLALTIFKEAGNAPIKTSVTLEYEFSEEWVLAVITTQKVEGALKITGIDIKPIPEAIEIVNGFTFANRGWQQYEVLLLAIAALVLNLCATVLCVRTRLGKYKWLWLAFIQVGIGKLAVNWTTGEMSLTPLNVQMIMPSGAYALGIAPWTVFVSLPIGAIAFLFYRSSKSVPVDAQPSLASGVQADSALDHAATKPDTDI